MEEIDNKSCTGLHTLLAEEGYPVVPMERRSGVSETADIPGLQQDARQAWGFGLVSVLLCIVAPCSSYMTLLLALPLGGVAWLSGRRILASSPDEVTEVYARTAQITGMISLIFSTLMLLFAVVFVVLYGGLIAALVAADL